MKELAEEELKKAQEKVEEELESISEFLLTELETMIEKMSQYERQFSRDFQKRKTLYEKELKSEKTSQEEKVIIHLTYQHQTSLAASLSFYEYVLHMLQSLALTIGVVRLKAKLDNAIRDGTRSEITEKLEAIESTKEELKKVLKSVMKDIKKAEESRSKDLAYVD